MPDIKSTDLQVNQSIEAAAPDALLNIIVDPRKPLGLGAYVFQLQVTDDSGNVSVLAKKQVLIIDLDAPTAVIDAPDKVGFAKAFTLSGKNSADAGGGKIAKYTWTLIQTP